MLSWDKKVNEEEFFNKAIADVNDWNELVGKGRPIDEKQLQLVRDEVEEAIEAYESKGIHEFIQEVCDVFVTSAPFISNSFNCHWGTEDYQLDQILSWMDSLLKEDSFKGIGALVCTSKIFQLIDIDWRSYLSATLKSNTSKLSIYEGTASQTIDLDYYRIVLEADGRYQGVYWEVVLDKSGIEWVVFKDSNGKVLKGPDFRDVEYFL